jgi:hypothetical protein
MDRVVDSDFNSEHQNFNRKFLAVDNETISDADRENRKMAIKNEISSMFGIVYENVNRTDPKRNNNIDIGDLTTKRLMESMFEEIAVAYIDCVTALNLWDMRPTISFSSEPWGENAETGNMGSESRSYGDISQININYDFFIDCFRKSFGRPVQEVANFKRLQEVVSHELGHVYVASHYPRSDQKAAYLAKAWRENHDPDSFDKYYAAKAEQFSRLFSKEYFQYKKFVRQRERARS